jgi:hypothetical protein
MAGVVSNANLGGVADARYGEEADAIGTEHEHQAGIDKAIPPPDTHGHNTIYLDNSITFENYHYWANRSREFEKHIRTDNQGLRQIFNILLGRKVPNDPPVLDNAEIPGPTGSSGTSAGEKTGDNENNSAIARGGWSHAVTESEWEQAQRATRTATWGG